MTRFYCYFDGQSGRYVLQGKELHCGDCFQIREGDAWHDVRIEMSGRKWYLHGVPNGCSTEPDAYEARLYSNSPLQPSKPKTINNKTHRELPDGMERLIKPGEYRAVDDLFYSIWFFDEVYGCVVGTGDNGAYDFILAQKVDGNWTVLKQSDCAYGSTTYALRDLIVACDQHFPKGIVI